jgi:hypothetical protein
MIRDIRVISEEGVDAPAGARLRLDEFINSFLAQMGCTSSHFKPSLAISLRTVRLKLACDVIPATSERCMHAESDFVYSSVYCINS